MAANFAADLTLTQEQECLKRLLLLGRLVKASNPASEYYVTTPQYNRATGVVGAAVRAPRETYQITFDLDADLLDQALNCYMPLYMAAMPVANAVPNLVCTIPSFINNPGDNPPPDPEPEPEPEPEPSGFNGQPNAIGTP